ncbi:unnamed protein product [Fusarium equiseti]|uniref:Uncharacterized protein n=1 Tax=Fusarium equiseti TaxID=61235 RepID=A0A8J2NGK5_FUSEQ|nr:unnamed protein product [Fusarium equiseti]
MSITILSLLTFETRPPIPKSNSTWHGRSLSELKSSWTMAVDRFVDPYWSNGSNTIDRLGTFLGDTRGPNGHPILFKNETDLNVTPTNLLFLAGFSEYLHSAGRKVEAECFVTQRYVESQVHCSRVDASTPQNCSVTAQRLSQKEHVTENITMLNWALIWSRVSKLPTFLDGYPRFADATLQYLSNPRLNAVTGKGIGADIEFELFNKTTAEQFSCRLGQVINTHLLLGQVYKSAVQMDQVFDFNTTVPAERTELVEVNIVNWSWTILFLSSSVVLLVSGVVSIVFAHLAIGPEVLGYASSVVQNSKYVELPAQTRKKEAFEVVKMMGQKRLRYGYVDSVAEDGQPLVGVGLESETGDIHKC